MDVPHLSVLADFVQSVMVGNDTLSMEWDNVSTTVIIGSSDHAAKDNEK